MESSHQVQYLQQMLLYSLKTNSITIRSPTCRCMDGCRSCQQLLVLTAVNLFNTLGWRERQIDREIIKRAIVTALENFTNFLFSSQMMAIFEERIAI